MSTDRLSSSADPRRGFTLVELLVVIGIIALLISILLPTLGNARERANVIKCASNQRTIGQGLALYAAENRGLLPAAYMYASPNGGPQPTTPTDGYIHWSSYLYGTKGKSGDLSIYGNLNGWGAFLCPSMDDGGLPPTNTFDGNVGSGLTNDAGGVIDQQAPRLAYTVNEALMPRNKFEANFDGNPRTYQLVKIATVRRPAEIILATEFTGNPAMVQGPGRVGGAMVSKSHRPVHGFWAPNGGDGYELDKVALGSPAAYLRNYDLPKGMPSTFSPNRLAWVGRNHGKLKFSAANQDQRQTNFLYADGHVATKRLSETVYPSFEWGERFYSIRQNDGFQLKAPTSGQIDNLK